MSNIHNFFKSKKILITGHTGFKGSWLTEVLLNWGADVIGVALKPEVSPNLFTMLGIQKKIKNYFCDIRDFQALKKIVIREKPEIILHLAAQPLVRDSYDDPLYTFETNVLGSANLLQATKESGKAKSVVMITTDKVYKEKGKNYSYKEDDKLGGFDPYSSSKAGAEIVIDSYIKSFFNPNDYNKIHKTLVASVRSGNVIGGGDWQKDRILPDIIRAVFEKKEKLIIRNPESVRPWQYVLEPLYGYMLLAKRLYEGEKELSGAWNFGPKEKNYLTVQKITDKTLKMLKRGSYPSPLKKFLRVRDKKHEADFLKLNTSKSEELLGWKPIFNLDKTLKLTLDWYKTFYGKKDIVKITDQQIKLFFEKV